MILLAYAVALTAIGWTVWVRRGTWRNSWESPTTAASLMLGMALILIAPDAEPIIGRALFLITGRWHLDDLLGHLLEAAALASSTLVGLMRMPSMRNRITALLRWRSSRSCGRCRSLGAHNAWVSLTTSIVGPAVVDISHDGDARRARRSFKDPAIDGLDATLVVHTEPNGRTTVNLTVQEPAPVGVSRDML